MKPAFAISPWTLLALLVVLAVLVPVVAVAWLALRPGDNIWPHLWATILPGSIWNTFVLAVGTGILSSAIGTGAAWLVTLHRFPLSRVFEWLLFLPLAVPAWLSAITFVEVFDYTGPVQSLLRASFGWESARDYFFPEIRSPLAAVVVLSAALFPYPYMLARAAFRDHPAGTYEVARALGSGSVALFWRVGLPLARPAIAAGAAIAMMETVADYGVADFFAVQTLTTSVVAVWLEGGNAGAAAQIALLLLGASLMLLALERQARGWRRFHAVSGQPREIARTTLRGMRAAAALALCLAPILVGLILPLGILCGQLLARPAAWIDPGLARALWHTFLTGGVAAVIAVAAATMLIFGSRQAGNPVISRLLPVSMLGYATPGAVLALGLILPLAAFDHLAARAWSAISGASPGLLLTGTASAIVWAYAVRFFGAAQGTLEAGFQRIPPSLPLAARSLGRTAPGALRDVQLPLLRGSVAVALLLVFVDCAKELPATLLLRPFNFDTLATRVYEKSGLARLAEAAPSALLIVALGCLAVLAVVRLDARRSAR